MENLPIVLNQVTNFRNLCEKHGIVVSNNHPRFNAKGFNRTYCEPSDWNLQKEWTRSYNGAKVLSISQWMDLTGKSTPSDEFSRMEMLCEFQIELHRQLGWSLVLSGEKARMLRQLGCYDMFRSGSKYCLCTWTNGFRSIVWDAKAQLRFPEKSTYLPKILEIIRKNSFSFEKEEQK